MRAYFHQLPYFFSLCLYIGGMCLSSCGYQLDQDNNPLMHTTMAIPYIEGDANGELTTELIKKISQSGLCRYSPEGNLVLIVKKIDSDDENVGFRYDRKSSGKLKKSLIPAETRVHATVEVTLVDSLTKKILRGPTRIAAQTDFDHCFYSSRNEINIFSLGQVSNIDSAREIAMTPLDHVLADKIVDYIVHCW